MPRTPSSRPTVRSIAARAGVSAATVSRVLAGTTVVTSETAARVRAAKAELSGEESVRVVYVRCPYVLTDYFGFIVSAVVEALQGYGWRVELDAGNRTQLQHLLPALADRPDISGAIAVLPTESADELERVARRMPLVVLDPREPLPHTVATVAANHLAAAHGLAEHLVSLGHRRIGAIVGPTDWRASSDRVAGLASALAAVGVLHSPELVRSIDPTFEQGVSAAGELLELPDPPTALMCFNDKVAVGALRAAADRGLRVPADLSVSGFDDLDVGHVTQPPLTTVRQSLDEMGRIAASLLQRMIEGAAPTVPQVQVATRLIVRESTGVAPAAAP